MDVVTLVGVLRHLREEDDEEHHHDDRSDGEIGGDEHIEVGILHRLEVGIAQQGPFVAAQGIELRLDEVHRHEHTDDRTAGVKTLGEVQAARGGFRLTHREDIGVAGGLEKRQTTGHNEVGDEETTVDADGLRGEEQQGTRGIESEAHKHTSLVTVLTDKKGSREGHSEIAAIEGHLYE